MLDFRKFELVSSPEHRPQQISEIGVRESLLEDLALKTLYISGPFSVLDLSERMRVSFDVAHDLFSRLRGKLLCEVTGMTGNIPYLAITSQGRSRAIELLSLSQYAGPAPVSLASYVEQVRKQSVRDVEVRPPAVERAFLDSLALERQPARDLSAVYGGWLARIEALAAARLSGSYEIKDESGLIDRRRRALEEHSRLAREVAQLRAQAARAKQINQRVDLNQKIKAMETAIDKTKKLMLVDGA